LELFVNLYKYTIDIIKKFVSFHSLFFAKKFPLSFSERGVISVIILFMGIQGYCSVGIRHY